MKTGKILLSLVCILFVCIHVNAQEECRTPASVPPAWLFNPSLRSMPVSGRPEVSSCISLSGDHPPHRTQRRFITAPSANNVKGGSRNK